MQKKNAVECFLIKVISSWHSYVNVSQILQLPLYLIIRLNWHNISIYQLWMHAIFHYTVMTHGGRQWQPIEYLHSDHFLRD